MKNELKKHNIPFSPPDIGEEEIQEVADTLCSGWITTGPKTKELERQVAEFCGVNKAVCLNSATSCLEMALTLNIKKINLDLRELKRFNISF